MKEGRAVKVFKKFYTDDKLVNLYDKNLKGRFVETAFYQKSLINYKMKRFNSINTLEFFKSAFSFNVLFWAMRAEPQIYNIYSTMVEFKFPYPYMCQPEIYRMHRWDIKEYQKYAKKIRYVIDVDAKDSKDLKMLAKKTLKLISRLKDPKVYFSGMGFHIYDKTVDEEIGTSMKKAARKTQTLDKEMICDLKIYDYMRIIKMPESMAVYQEEEEYTMFSCDEITPEELKDFDHAKHELR